MFKVSPVLLFSICAVASVLALVLPRSNYLHLYQLVTIEPLIACVVCHIDKDKTIHFKNDHCFCA